MAASVAVLSPSAAFAQRGPSPYAFDDSVDPTSVDVAGTTNQDPGVTGSQTATDPGLATSPLEGIAPLVQADALPTQADAVQTPAGEPSDTGNQIGPLGLPRTGMEIMERVAFALFLVAVGMAVWNLSRRRRRLLLDS